MNPGIWLWESGIGEPNHQGIDTAITFSHFPAIATTKLKEQLKGIFLPWAMN